MAYFRCGGGGVPASVKTDMNAVLNKKFGTSTDYPPADWAPTVNLMGPLPEKTASGSIAHIEDGADAVPLKSWEVTLPASLTGYTAIHGTKNTGTGTPETQYTASLGRTIYGGTADVVNGTGKENYSVPTALNSLTWTKTTIGGHDCFFANLPNGYIGSGSSYVDGVCDDYAITFDGNMGTDKTIRFYFNSSFNFSRVSIRDDQYASYTGAQFKEAVTGDIVYQLADSATTDFTFTPITPTPETALGVNNFWSDSGDTEVTYRADIDLLLGGN